MLLGSLTPLPRKTDTAQLNTQRAITLQVLETARNYSDQRTPNIPTLDNVKFKKLENTSILNFRQQKLCNI